MWSRVSAVHPGDTPLAPSTSRVVPSTRTSANLVISRTETFVLPREAAGVQPALRSFGIGPRGESPHTGEPTLRGERPARLALECEEADANDSASECSCSVNSRRAEAMSMGADIVVFQKREDRFTR